MGRRGKGKCSTKRPPQRISCKEQAAGLAAPSDSSLDEGLLDYLRNTQQDRSGDENADDTPQQLHSIENAAQGHTPKPAGFEGGFDDDPDSWRPGLGYHPQHGFSSTAAAAQFAGSSLDHMLEGNLALDLQRTASMPSDDSSSSTDTDDDSDEGDSSSSSSSTPSDEGGILATSRGFDASVPVVVDASGRRQQSWHDLSIQERFPVQTRQQLNPAAAAARGSGSRHRSSQPLFPRSSSREATANSISTAMLTSSLPSQAPHFEQESLSAVVAAATAAAADMAKQQVAQYAELAQQLQQAKQNRSQRPGRQGRGVKKQMKKAKVAAKRVVREARSGVAALQLLAAVEAFVSSGQDMQILPPCGTRQKEGFAKQLARLFGVSAASQGGSSSGHTCLVLRATSDTAADLDEAQLQQLTALLRAELAREMASGAIARDDTLVTLKKDRKQRRRSSQQQQQQDLQRQRSRGGDRAATPDYQQPVAFVAAGLLDPNSSMRTQDAYLEAAAAALGTGSEDDDGLSSAASTTSGELDASPAAEHDAAAAARAAGVRPSHDEVGPFLESLLLSDPAQATAVTGTAAAAAASPTGSQSQGQQQERSVQSQHNTTAQQQPSAAGQAWFVDQEGKDPPSNPWSTTAAAAAGSTGGESAAAESAGGRPVLTASHQQLQQQGDESAAEAAPGVPPMGPVWFEDRTPQQTTHSQGRTGGIFVAAATMSVVTPEPERGAAGAAIGWEAPVYDRPGLGLGFGSHTAVQQANSEALTEQQQQQQQPEGSQSSREAAGSGGVGHRHGGAGSDRVAQLEARFRSLQTPGGPQAADQQPSTRQRRRQQRQEERAARGKAPRGAARAAPVAGAADDDDAVVTQPTFNMTAQQSKKAKKQQARNQRREANRAAAPTGPQDGGTAAVGAVVPPAVGFATFEVHTTGIGSRLLGRWGWSEGEGLGRARQGRAEPLCAERRPKQLGLGYE